MTSLKVVQGKKCIGCELCVMECQRQLNRAGLSGSYIRIMRSIKEGDKFEVSIDPKITELELAKIMEVCPHGALEESKDNQV